jgi:hypothetical protein
VIIINQIRLNLQKPQMGTIDGKKGEKIGPKSGNFNVCATTEKPNAADSKKSLD